MPAITVLPPYALFTDVDGEPLENGYIYIGEDSLDPQTNPLATYWDVDLEIPAGQPIRTVNGYPARDGSAAELFVDANDFSITVLDANGVLVFSKPNYTLSLPSVAQTYTVEQPGGIVRAYSDKMNEFVSVKDFGAVGDGVTDDTAAFVLAEALGASLPYIYIPEGTYVVAGLVLAKTYWGPGLIELDDVLQIRYWDQVLLATTVTIDSIVPIGGTLLWPTGTLPNDRYLEQNGAAFDPVTYPDLAAVFPSNTLPDTRGEFIRGWDNGRGVDTGRVILSQQSQAIQSHTHDIATGALDQTGGAYIDTASDLTEYRTSVATGGPETRPRNVAFMYIVRAL